jgi:hypothetical protein
MKATIQKEPPGFVRRPGFGWQCDCGEAVPAADYGILIAFGIITVLYIVSYMYDERRHVEPMQRGAYIDVERCSSTW